jgi:antitoxin component YwqK of YwqJK toxin-antitoxin module
LNRFITTTTFSLKIKKIVYIVFPLILMVVATFDVAAQDEMEYVVYYYENGQVSSEGFMQNGRPNGYWKTYFPNGELQSEGNRVDFELDSTWVFYGDEGMKNSEIDYKNGVKEGVVKTYKNGVLQQVGQYCAGSKCGISTYYYPTGEVSKVVPYENGKEHGEGFEYDVDGRVITLLKYQEGFLRRADKINRLDDRGNKRGPWISYHPNGKVAEEGFYMNDKKNGIFKTFNKQGDLLTLEKYRDGELVVDSEESVILDLRNTYYPDGKVKSSGGYVEGKKEGTHRVYASTGEVISGELYSKGEKIGEGIVDQNGGFQGDWKLYYDSGELKAEGKYEDSERTGEWIFYHPNGTVEHKGKYVKGLPQGAWKWYYDNGKLRRDEFYRRGKEDGAVIEYDIEGNIVIEGNYVSGLREGDWFYHVGDHTERGKFVDGERQGEWIYEYPEGELNYRGSYTAGYAVGKHRWYYPDGTIKMEGKYSSGIRVGTWKKYDEQGLMILNIKYKGGREVKINGKKVEQVEEGEAILDS